MKNFIKKSLVALFKSQNRYAYGLPAQKTESAKRTMAIDQPATINEILHRIKCSQKMRILLLLSNGPMTTFDALDKGIARPAAVIFELRKMGYNINTKMIRVVSRKGEVTRIACYILNWSEHG